MPNLPRSAGRKCGNRNRGKPRPQPAQQPVIGTKFMSPLRNTMSLIDREQSHWHSSQPIEIVLHRQSLRRQIKKSILSRDRPRHDRPPLIAAQKTIQSRRRNPHLPQSCRLVLHQRNQRRHYHYSFFRDHRRQLIAQRLPAPSRHHCANVMPTQQAPNNLFLLWAKRVIPPIPAQRSKQICIAGSARTLNLTFTRRANIRKTSLSTRVNRSGRHVRSIWKAGQPEPRPGICFSWYLCTWMVN